MKILKILMILTFVTLLLSEDLLNVQPNALAPQEQKQVIPQEPE